MLIEIQHTHNFITSYLYNQLPRRRVNIFGEELEKALKEKFVGHWYPREPEKGSGFRCIKVGLAKDPPDPVLEKAAVKSGICINEVMQLLPSEMTVWIDPGEVSYKVGDKGVVYRLYESKMDSSPDDSSDDGEIFRTFNPEAKIFNPKSSANFPMIVPGGRYYDRVKSPAAHFYPCMPARPTTPTYTPEEFAQTKFGSTKRKTNAKRHNPKMTMSSTQLSQHIKRIIQEKEQRNSISPTSPNSLSSLSPQMHGFGESSYFFPQGRNYYNQTADNGLGNDLFVNFDLGLGPGFNQNGTTAPLSPVNNGQAKNFNGESLETLNSSPNGSSYPPLSPYQQLLLAN